MIDLQKRRHMYPVYNQMKSSGYERIHWVRHANAVRKILFYCHHNNSKITTCLQANSLTWFQAHYLVLRDFTILLSGNFSATFKRLYDVPKLSRSKVNKSRSLLYRTYLVAGMIMAGEWLCFGMPNHNSKIVKPLRSKSLLPMPPMQ